MKTMLDYLEEANGLLGAVWGDASTAEIRGYLKTHLPDWSTEEHEELLIMSSALARCHAEGAREAIASAECTATDASKTAKAISAFRVREADKRENARRSDVIERHFGAARRGELPDASGAVSNGGAA